MNFKRIYAVFLRQWYLIRGSSTRFLQMFIWVTVDITLWGFISRYLAGATDGALHFTALLLGAVLLWDFLIQVMQGVTMSFFEDVWARNFLNIFASPLRISEYLAGFVLASIARAVLVFLLMIVLSTLIFGFSVFAYGTSLGVFLFILFVFGIVLGVVGVSIVMRLGPSAEWFVWPIPTVIAPFVGVFYPTSVLPLWMQYLGNVLPPTYVFEGIRAIVNGAPFPLWPLVWSVVLSFAYLILAYRLFVAVYRHAVRTGLFARYSADTTN